MTVAVDYNLTTTTKYSFKDSFVFKIVPEFQISDATFVMGKISILREYHAMSLKLQQTRKVDTKSEEKSVKAFRDTVATRGTATGARETMNLSLRQTLARDTSVRRTSMYVSSRNSKFAPKKAQGAEPNSEEKQMRVITRDALVDLVTFMTPNSEEKDVLAREVTF